MQHPSERSARAGALVLALGCGACSGGMTVTTTSATESSTTTTDATTTVGPGTTIDPTTISTDPETTTTTTGEGYSTTAAEPFCGDGHVDPGEACDDGNDDPADGCLPDCSIGPGGLLGCFDRQADGEEEDNVAIAWAPAYSDFASPLLVGGTRGAREGPPKRSFVRYIDPATELTEIDVVESADAYHRTVGELEFGVDGHVVVGGWAMPIDFDPNEHISADLWLALFGAEGTIEKSALIPTFGWIAGLGVSGAGQVVTLVQRPLDSVVAVFSPDLVMEWSYMDWEVEPLGSNSFSGLAIDPTGTIYVTGDRRDPDTKTHAILLMALDPSGAALWEAIEPSPTHSDAEGSRVFLDASGDVVVAGTEWDGLGSPHTLVFARFDVDGTPLTWASWDPENEDLSVHVGAVLAAPAGGSFLSLYSPADEWISFLARFDADGAPIWVHEHEPGTATLYDLAYDPAGTLYGVRIDEVCAFAP